MTTNQKETLIHVDFETRSMVDLKKSGVHRYALDPSTEIICMSYAIGDKDPDIWLQGQPFPDDLFLALLEPHRLKAWNAMFEILIWRYVGVARLGWPEAPMREWDDVMGDAACCSLPLGLDACAAALGVANQKSGNGKNLKTKLCEPYKGSFRTYEDFREDFLAMYEYCKQDVRAERDTYHALPYHVEGDEKEIQYLTWEANHRGLPVAIDDVMAINEVLEDYIVVLNKKIYEITGGKIGNANQREAILHSLDANAEAVKPWLAEREERKALGEKVGTSYISKVPGAKIVAVGKYFLPDILKNMDLSDYDRKVLMVYQERNHASIAKYKRILLQICDDTTVKDNMQYHGAGTGRDAGRGFQAQNLPRASTKTPDELLQCFIDHDAEFLTMFFHILEEATKLIRHMIKAHAGMKLVVSDYGQIEARGTGWVAKEKDILQNFVDGIDPYVAQASKMYAVEMDDVDKTQRQYGKLAILACGYQGSHKALTDFAEGYGLSIERKDAVDVVKKFRQARPKLVAAWASFGEAAKAAVERAGQSFQVEDCERAIFKMQGKYLTLELPSGRRLWYPEAKIEPQRIKYVCGETGEDKFFETEGVTYLKNDGKKSFRVGMSGGKFLQNYVQAICRDLIMHAHINLNKAGYPVVVRVHDEAVAHCPDDGRFTIKEMDRIMCILPGWAKSMPVTSDGYESYRYKK